MTTIYSSLSSLSSLSQRIKKERERVSELLLVAESNLNELELGISAEVEISEGARLRFSSKGLQVLQGEWEGEELVVKHWIDCAPDVQVNALFGFRPLIEQLEKTSRKLLSDLTTVQELAKESGIGFDSQESEPKADKTPFIINVSQDEPASRLEPVKSSVPVFDSDAHLRLVIPKEDKVPGNGQALPTTLIPFRRFGKPHGPVPPVTDVKGQKEYTKKLLLWYFTNTIEETGYDSVRKLVNDHGILMSRAYNMKPYIRKHFSYIFKNDGIPWVHDTSEAHLNKMFTFINEDDVQ